MKDFALQLKPSAQPAEYMLNADDALLSFAVHRF